MILIMTLTLLSSQHPPTPKSQHMHPLSPTNPVSIQVSTGNGMAVFRSFPNGLLAVQTSSEIDTGRDSVQDVEFLEGLPLAMYIGIYICISTYCACLYVYILCLFDILQHKETYFIMCTVPPQAKEYISPAWQTVHVNDKSQNETQQLCPLCIMAFSWVK